MMMPEEGTTPQAVPEEQILYVPASAQMDLDASQGWFDAAAGSQRNLMQEFQDMLGDD